MPTLHQSVGSSRLGDRRRCGSPPLLSLLGFVATVAFCCLLYTGVKMGATRVRLISAKGSNSLYSQVIDSERSSSELFADSQEHRSAEGFIQSGRPLTLENTAKVDFALAKSINKQIQPPLSKTFNCQKLFEGNKEETHRAMEFQRNSKYIAPTYSDIMQSTMNCAAFRAARSYATKSSAEEASFPLAFSIVMHKSVEQFERMLRAIYRPVNYYCVHVDKKAKPYIHQAVRAIVACFSNVFVVSKLESVVYAGYTRLQADINCANDLFTRFSNWKYLLNTVGTEFPLLPNRQIVYILKLYNGTNMVERHMATIDLWRHQRKFKLWFTKNNRTGRLVKVSDHNSPPPFNLNVTKCSAFGAFSRACIDYVLHDPVAQAFLEWSKSTYSSDELFWGTLNDLHRNPQLKTPGGDLGDEDNHLTRAVMWKSPKCHGRNVHIICNFGAGDLPWLYRSYQLFANKFDLSVDQVAYGCMEELLQERNRDPKPHKLKPFTTYLRHARGEPDL